MALSSPIQFAPGTHAWFALEGATLTDAANVIKPTGDATAYTVAGRTANPSASDGAYVKLQHVQKIELATDNGQGIEEWIPVPGGIELNEILRVKRKRTFKIHCSRIQPITFQLLLQTLELNGSSTQFNPGEAPGEVNGWLRVRIYDHKNTLRASVDHFVELILSDALTLDPGARVDPVYMATGLYSVLNTGAL